jgi:hypothetical protein
MCKAGKKSITPIEWAAVLTEFALLGTLAQRRRAMPAPPPPAAAAGGRGGGGGRGGRQENKVLAWDSKAMKFTNDDVASSLVDTPYRKEWDYKV